MENTKKGIDFIEALQLILIVLKLCGVIKWKWIWVLTPTWVELIIFIIVLVIYFIVKRKSL